MSFLIVLSLTLLILAWLIGEPFLVRWRRQRIRNQTFPPAWRRILRRRVPYVAKLPSDLQRQLKQHIQVFIAEKSFIGCGGQTMTDDVRVTIAAQACLLTLNHMRDDYRMLHEILVYPSAFRVDRVNVDSMGLQQELRQVLAGESWTRGQVILSWKDVVTDAATIDDGRNVVIHEFAHQLDQEKGYANGAPYLPRGEAHERWSRVMGEAYERLQRDALYGQPSLLNHYGASHPAEFFAVATEVFFEQAADMAAEHPELYRELSAFYRLNPLAW